MAEGDPGAEEVTKRFVQWVSAGLVNLIALLDPEIIVLGGGLTAINRHFLSEVQLRVNETMMGAAYRPVVPIVPARLGAEAGAIGAAISSSDMFLGR